MLRAHTPSKLLKLGDSTPLATEQAEPYFDYPTDAFVLLVSREVGMGSLQPAKAARQRGTAGYAFQRLFHSK